MTKLLEKLNQQLVNTVTTPIMKDEARQRWFTGGEFQKDLATVRQQLLDMRVRKGDQILVSWDNSAVYPVLMQAIWELGAVAHPISETTPAAQLVSEWQEFHYPVVIVKPELVAAFASVADLVQSQVVLEMAPVLPILGDQSQLAQRAATVQQTIQEDDLALILNTSGTTGKPKRVGLSHRLLLNGSEHDIVSHKMTAADTAMIIMPMFHINAQVMSVLSTRLSGGKLLITKKFSASHFWQQVKANQVTWVSVVPTIITILLLNEAANQAYTVDIKLRFVRCSSFALPEDKLREFESRFHTQILEGYGMTETASQCTINPFDAPKIGSAGKPFGTELALLVDNHFTKEPHRVGEIAVRGDHVIAHYLDVANDSFKDGWFLTGDLGYLDEDGYLFVKGRRKEMISHGGEKVAPAAVENCLNELDFIAGIAVIGLPDALYGEAVTAVVLSRTPGKHEAAQRAAIFEYAERHLARYQRPTDVRFVTEFPRNPTGKVLRPKLREQLLAVTVGEK